MEIRRSSLVAVLVAACMMLPVGAISEAAAAMSGMRNDGAPRSCTQTTIDAHHGQAIWGMNTTKGLTADNVTLKGNAAVLADGLGRWGTKGPGNDAGITGVWDTKNDQYLLYGGYTCETWAYSPGNNLWVRKADGPVPRIDHSAVWDAVNMQMLIYGGQNVTEHFNELWAYNPDTDKWTQKTSGLRRFAHAAAWDSQHDQMLVFGGVVEPSYWESNDLWAYDPARDTWTRKASGATARAHHTAVWDTRSNQLLVYGGGSTLWAYNATSDSWTQKTGTSHSVSRHMAVYDEPDDMMIVYGGSVNGNWDQLWFYNCSADLWDRDYRAGPGDRRGQVAAWDNKDSRMLMYDGSGHGPRHDMWSYTPASGWKLLWGAVQKCSHAAVYDTADDQMLLFSGSWSDNTVAYDVAKNVWSTRTTWPNPRVEYSAVWDPDDRAAILYGGASNLVALNDLWVYYPSNDSWFRRANGPFRAMHTAVWDGPDGRMIVFGGFNETKKWPQEVWYYDFQNDTWAQVAVSGAVPSGRGQHVAVWDGADDQMLIHGGYYNEGSNSYYLGDLWAYSPDTQRWTQKRSAAPRYHHVAVWDDEHLEMIVSGEYYQDPSNTMAYTPATDTWSAKAEYRHEMRDSSAVWDSRRKEMLVFGGQMVDGDTFRCFNLSYNRSGYLRADPQLLSTDIYSIEQVIINCSVPDRTGIRLMMRTSDDRTNWSDWAEVPNGSRPESLGRYTEWIASLTTDLPELTPRLFNISVDYTTNRRPTVVATAPSRAYRKVPIPLNGTVADADGDVPSLLWTQAAGQIVEISNSTSAKAAFIATLPGDYSFALTADDGYARVQSLAVNITVANRVPVARPGADFAALAGRPVHLEGSGSDEDGDDLTYIWTQTEGLPAPLDDPSSATPSFTPVRLGFYAYSLAVSDGYNLSEPSVVGISVSTRSPTGTTDPDLTAYRNQTVILGCNVTDADEDPITYSWESVSGPPAVLRNRDSNHPDFVPSSIGLHKFQVSASDPFGGKWTGRQNVTVLNRRPLADAGPDQIGMLNAVVRLSGNASDGDGDPLSVRWTQISGVLVHINEPQQVNASFTPLVPDTYVFKLAVNDGFDEATSNSTVVVDRLNHPPRFKTTPPESGKVGTLYTFLVIVEDDDTGDRLVLSLVSGPGGMWILGQTLQWLPEKNQTGERAVSLSLSDGTVTIFLNWTIEVKPGSGSTGNGTTIFPPSLIIAAVLVTTTIVALGIILRRRRSSRGQRPASPPPRF